jgi:hypothetical protein
MMLCIGRLVLSLDEYLVSQKIEYICIKGNCVQDFIDIVRVSVITGPVWSQYSRTKKY